MFWLGRAGVYFGMCVMGCRRCGVFCDCLCGALWRVYNSVECGVVCAEVFTTTRSRPSVRERLRDWEV